MQPPTLSPTQRAYMNDPQGFTLRMARRAEELPFDGYTVASSPFAHLFIVTTPKGEQYTVAPLSMSCTCAYQEKGDVPQVPCKHLQGLSELVSWEMAHLKQFAEVGDSRLSADRLQARRELETFWQAMLDEQTRRQSEEADRTCEYDRQEREVREAGFAEF